MIKNSLLFFCLIITSTYCQAQDSSIVVHFLYGSKPARGFEHIEKKSFGGKKGGHVTIETGNKIIGFQPKGTCHVFGSKKKANGYFRADDKEKWVKDTVSRKYSSVIIPVSPAQYLKVQNTLHNYLEKRPYDYAVFGMRCAAATYDVLEDAGIVKKRSRFGKWASFFYPQLLRRRILKLAEKNNYAVVKHNGRKSRSWEME
jgi:hypothetical protein